MYLSFIETQRSDIFLIAIAPRGIFCSMENVDSIVERIEVSLFQSRDGHWLQVWKAVARRRETRDACPINGKCVRYHYPIAYR